MQNVKQYSYFSSPLHSIISMQNMLLWALDTEANVNFDSSGWGNQCSKPTVDKIKVQSKNDYTQI